MTEYYSAYTRGNAVTQDNVKETGDLVLRQINRKEKTDRHCVISSVDSKLVGLSEKDKRLVTRV